MLELCVYNDGKKKHNSFEVWVKILNFSKGYGSTEEEAIADYLIKFNSFLTEMEFIHCLLKDSDFKKKITNYAGKEL